MADYDLLHDGEELDACIDEVVAARGSEASLSARLADIVSDFEADQQRQETEIGAVAALGAKNTLLITNTNNTLVVNGITFTKNADQTITATGTATANADYPLNSAQTLIIGQQYILSGCPSGGGADNFFLRQLSGAIDYGDGVTFTAESSSANFFIRIRNGYTIQGSLTFKPMLRPAEITDDTFVPYAPTNRELYEEKNQLQAKVDQITGIEKQIPSDADLNAYYDPGVYQILSTAIAQTLVNIPSDCKVAGSIEVKRLNGSARIQFYYPNWASSGTNPGSFYFRQRTGAQNWSAWYYFSGTQVASASTQSAPASLMQAGRIDAELTGTDEEAAT